MRTSALILCACLALVMTSTVSAQPDMHIWMDMRSNTASGIGSITGTFGANNPWNLDPNKFNEGRKGSGTTLFLEPTQASGLHAGSTSFPNIDLDSDRSTGDLWVYIDMNTVDDPAKDVLASLGLDVEIAQHGGSLPRNRIHDVCFSILNENGVWDNGGSPGFVHGSKVPGDPPQWEGAKAVRVPVASPGPVYDVTNPAIRPNEGIGDNTVAPYRVARLRVQAGPRSCTGLVPTHAPNSVFRVDLKVNNLLIARVFEPGGPSPHTEMVSFGFDAPVGIVADPQTAVSGSAAGAGVSALPQALVIVRLKGDFTGTGTVTSADIGPLLTAQAGPNGPMTAFLGSFTPAPANQVTSADTGGFFTKQAGSAPCAVGPAPSALVCNP